MSIKDIKSEARQKLAVNMHQAVVVYAIEYVLLASLVMLVTVACLGWFDPENLGPMVIIILYGVVMLLLLLVAGGIMNFAMVDLYLVSYRCKPYNVRRLADTLARNGVLKILSLSLIRTIFGFLFTLLLIVPGMFYMSRTSMASYFLNANPKIKPNTALSASAKVMSSKTGAYMALMASMIGWYFVGLLTLGVGFIFILPYVNLVKTVYYKRNLQGDKAVYQVPAQPISPPPQQQQQRGPAVAPPVMGDPLMGDPLMGGMPESRPLYGETERPIQIDTPIPPIDTLEDADFRQMRDAVVDVGGTPGPDVPVVPEVPLSPPLTSQPAAYAQQEGEPVDDSNLVQFVKPLTTQEADAAHVFDHKVDELYVPTKPKEEEPHVDYINMQHTQKPDDFVSRDLDPAEPSSGDKPDKSDKPDAAAQGEPVISDEDFDRFLSEFDAPKLPPDQPIVRRPADQAARPVTSRPPVGTGARPFAGTQRPSAAVPGQTPDAREAARREREERLRNLRNKE